MAKSTAYQTIGRWLDTTESRLSLLVHGVTIVAAFSLPAWATRAVGLFATYSPLSWVVAGFLGVLVWALIRIVWNVAYRIRVNAKYDFQAIEHNVDFNPLDLTFERKRIYISDLVLPSHPVIEGKTFIDCDLIGPATIYFHSSNQANPIRPPKMDAVWLAPEGTFASAFTFNNCIFRNCSFQRITMLASIENYDAWKDNPNVNWLSIAPRSDDIERRKQMVRDEFTKKGLPIPPQYAEAIKVIEHTETHEQTNTPK